MQKKQIVVDREGSNAVMMAKTICGTLAIIYYVCAALFLILAIANDFLLIAAGVCLEVGITCTVLACVLNGFHTVVYVKETEEAVNLGKYQIFDSQKDMDAYNKNQKIDNQ